jgi:hypothetical protein
MPARGLLAGFAAVDVTPPLTIPHLGFHPRRQGEFTGIHDPLFARAVAVSHGPQHLAVVSVDAIGLSRDLLGPGRDFIAELRQRATAGLPLRPEAVLAAATHAHSVPETYGITRLWETPAYRDWAESWCTALASAVRQAWEDRRPARLLLGQSRLDDLAVNRRLHLTGAGEEHPVDPVVSVLRFARPHGGDILLANAACHPVTVQVQELVSADFPGVACQRVEEAFGGGAHCLFVQGAAGDLNPVRGCTRDWADVADYGRRLGDAILEAALAARPARIGPASLRAESLSVAVAARPVPDAASMQAEWQQLEATLSNLPASDPAYTPAFQRRSQLSEALRLAAFGQEPIPAEIQVLRIGPAAVVGLPGEVFCALGCELRRRGPFSPTLVAELANGCLGYLVPEAGWNSGGYEVGLGAWCRVAKGEPERLLEAAVGLSLGLRADRRRCMVDSGIGIKSKRRPQTDDVYDDHTGAGRRPSSGLP